MAVQHVVLFSFAHEPSGAEYEEMRSLIAEWPAQIGTMRRLRFGADITGARNRGHSRLLFMEFDSLDALHAYQQHPVHRAFHQWVVDHNCTPLAFDYELDGSTVLMPESNGSSSPDFEEEDIRHGSHARS